MYVDILMKNAYDAGEQWQCISNGQNVMSEVLNVWIDKEPTVLGAELKQTVFFNAG